METDERIAALRASVEGFADAVAGLPEPLFLSEIGGRSPRDIVAHLIGWNHYTIEGYEQQRRGELPAYLVDPGEDFSTVNAAAMRRYAARDRAALLGQLRDSLAALDAFLGALAPAEWTDDYGVAYNGRPLALARLVGTLGGDYDHHREEIAAWPEQAGA
ncbi:MAG TPA: DinB family protein [Thermomicrobiales bacterium]|nr:DinB family protein [Thermomicrobiales bacterium]